MPNTTNFNWATPADTDLVKDGAAAIRTLGNSIDTSFVDLKGGTTGQVLSKASNTDLDFSWVAQDDSNAIQNALLTTTGDTIYASAASTPARLGIGTAGQVLAVNSGATAPEWKTMSAGGMTELASGNLSSTAVTLSNISQNYQDLRLVIRNPELTATGTRFALRWSGITASTYRYVWRDGGSLNASTTGEDRLWATINDLPTSASNYHMVYTFFDYTSAFGTLLVGETNENSTLTRSVYGRNGSNVAITEIIITTQNGTSTFDGGSYLLYGVA